MRIRTLLRWSGILLISVLAGVLAGVTAFAPLHLSVPIAVTVTIVTGMCYIGLWLHQQRAVRSGRYATARRWGWGLALAPFGVMLGAGAIALLQLYRMGQFPPLTQDRIANFDRLARAMAAAYPYFDEKGIDWEASVAVVRPQIVAAQTDDEYFRAIAAMLADLNDGHTRLSRPFPQITRLGQLAEVEGQAVIAATGPTAEAAGLAAGDVVLAIDGKDVATAIAGLPPQLRWGSTAWDRRDSALIHLLAVREPAESVVVTVQPANGGVRTVTLTPPQLPLTVSAGEGKSPPLVAGKRLSSGSGYIHLGENFGNRPGHDMMAEFDAALAGLMDAPALILDLRDNGGGSSLIANAIAGRFLTKPFVYGREYYRLRLPTRLWWRWGDRRVTPRPPFYIGPLVLLIDATTASSAEEFVVSLVDSGRAQTVGRQSAGSTGNPIIFQLPGDGQVSFSTGDLRRIDGAPLEGIGITPDVPVDWTLADLRQGRDPDLAEAVRLLLQ
jgi:C-terminal processing protease CtpA/Prc